jgi:hypothetical protein
VTGSVEVAVVADGRPAVATVSLDAAAGGTVWIHSRGERGSEGSLHSIGLQDSPASARAAPSMLAVTVHRSGPPPPQPSSSGRGSWRRRGCLVRPTHMCW